MPKEGELIPSLAWAKQELALVVQVQESGQSDQLSYNPGPDPRLWVGLS